MGVISEDYVEFKSSSFLISKIKRRLKNLGTVGLIDENDFPEYISEVLRKLGVAVYKEEEAILKVKDKKACLPSDFKQLYAAYKCTSDTPNTSQRHLQNVSVFEYDITNEIFNKGNGCEIECEGDEIIERVVLKQFVNDRYITSYFRNPILLTLSPNVKSISSPNCLNMQASGAFEISINKNTIYTNFDDGAILLKYYAFPVDNDGIPMIPDIIEIEKAIETYILWQLFMDFWLTDEIPNAVQKMQFLQAEYDEAFAEAKYYIKLPSFSKLVNSVKTKRSINAVTFFSQIDNKR